MERMGNLTLDITEARKQFSKLDERLRDDPIIWITRHGKKAFAVVDLELMEAVLETFEIMKDPTWAQMLADSVEDIRAGRTHDHEDVRKEFL